MNITDTHTHLYVEQFDPDRQQVVERALEQGVKRFLIPAIDSTYYERMFELRNAFPEAVHLMAGLHPTHVKEDFAQELGVVRKMLDTGEFIAVGEIGIDLYWDRTFLTQQQTAFITQIGWAREKSLPIVIHARDSFDEIFEILDQEQGPDLKGVFHCFTGSLEQAERIIGYGFKLGIGGVVTFKNGGIDKFLKRIDLGHLVIETDSPYLAPKPYRGKRNESAYLTLVVDKLADIYGVSREHVAEVTTQNANEVFGL
jgi:TatD DNase family protein